VPPLSIEIADLTWRPAGSDRLTLDLRGVSVSVPAGGVLLINGASGAGKSTLLRAIAGLLGTVLPGELQGRLVVGGVDLVAAATTESGIPRGLSERLGYVAAGPAPTYALPLLLDDAALPLESRQVPTEEMRSRIERFARDAAVDVALMDRSLSTFSGGERAAAAALVALVATPDLLIADEPLGGLDARSAERLALTLRESGATRVIAAHDLSLLDSATAQQLRLDGGRVVAPTTASATATTWSEIGSNDGGGAPIVQLLRATAAGRAVGPSSLAVMRSTTTLLTGDTGSGKSTLLHLVAGTLPLDTGERLTQPDLQIRFAPQDSGLLLGARPARAHIAPSDAARAEEIAQRLDVAHLLDAPSGRLSDGERRRLAIVVTIAAAPDVLILDEPSGGLDDARVAALGNLLSDRELLGTSALLIATHDPRLSALSRPDARPLRRVRHPEETGASVEAVAGGLAALLPAPAARVAESAERLLSPELGRRLIGTANPLTRLGLALFWFALSIASPTTPVAQAAIALPVLVVAWISGVQILATLKLAAVLTPALAGIVLANLFGGASVEEAVGAGTRLLAFAAGSLVLLRPFEPLRMADAFIEKLRAPFAPTMALLATAARIPTLRDEARERRAIRRLTRRGADPLLLADLFDSVIRAVPQLAIALEVRGVRLPTRQSPPTRRRPSRFGRADLLIVSLSAGGLLVSVARAVVEAILGA
jgi:energy-coupling factor transporter ATP-binding protein EcfA2/energy-coupling factor transporter transmembrane protein EcfT